MKSEYKNHKESFDRGKKNSRFAEEYIHQKYGIKINEDTPLDNMKRNIEVKSCQMILTDKGDHSFKKGIFVIRKSQHEVILERKGSYYFVLMHFNKAILDIRYRADKLNSMLIWDNFGYCRIPWDQVIPYSDIFKFVKETPPAELLPSKSFAREMLGSA